MSFSTDRAFRSLLLALVDVRLGGPESIPEYQRYGKFGSVQGQLRAMEDLGVITWGQLVQLTDLLLNASKHAGEPFPGVSNVGPVIPSWLALARRELPVKPSAQVPADERPSEVSAPASRPELRLFCLLVEDRSGNPRSLPVHTMRPMPPRVTPSGRWSLASDPAFHLRETRAERPSPEVLERCARQRQAHALRATARTVSTRGVSHAA